MTLEIPDPSFTIFLQNYALYNKTCLKLSLSKRPKMVFKINYRLMQVKVLQHAPRGAFCNTFDLH